MITTLRANIRDLDALAVLFNAYRTFYRQVSDIAVARAFLRERLQNNESVIFLARVVSSNEALGFIQLYPSFSSVAARRTWILNDLFVKPDARRRGIARALMACARAHATESKAPNLTLETADDNTAAHTLYESLGYVREVGTRRYLLMLE